MREPRAGDPVAPGEAERLEGVVLRGGLGGELVVSVLARHRLHLDALLDDVLEVGAERVQAVLQLVPLSTHFLSQRSVFESMLPAEVWMVGGLMVCYLVGSQVYARSTPELWPDTFGYHELWHLLIAMSVALTYACNCSVLTKCSTSRPCSF